MSQPSSEEPVDAETSPSPEPMEPAPVAADGWSLVSLLDFDGIEPPAGYTDADAQATWCAVSAPWHPALLAMASSLPQLESLEYPTPPGAREIRIVSGGRWERLPSGYRTQAEDAGCALVEGGSDRSGARRGAPFSNHDGIPAARGS